MIRDASGNKAARHESSYRLLDPDQRTATQYLSGSRAAVVAQKGQVKELLKRAQRLLADVQRVAETIQSASEALAAATLTAKGTPRREQPRQLRPSVMVERDQPPIRQPPRKKPAT